MSLPDTLKYLLDPVFIHEKITVVEFNRVNIIFARESLNIVQDSLSAIAAPAPLRYFRLNAKPAFVGASLAGAIADSSLAHGRCNIFFYVNQMKRQGWKAVNIFKLPVRIIHDFPIPFISYPQYIFYWFILA